MTFNKGFRSPTQKRISAVSTEALEARILGISHVRGLIAGNLKSLEWAGGFRNKEQRELISAMNFNVGQAHKELKARKRK